MSLLLPTTDLCCDTHVHVQLQVLAIRANRWVPLVEIGCADTFVFLNRLTGVTFLNFVVHLAVRGYATLHRGWY